MVGCSPSQTTATAIVAMALAAGVGGCCVAISRRFAIAAITCVLVLLIAQGLYIDLDATLRSLAYATLGGLVQALWALVVGPFRPRGRARRRAPAPAGRARRPAREPDDRLAQHAPCAPLERGPGARGCDLPGRRPRPARLLGAADDPLRAPPRARRDDAQDGDARRRDDRRAADRDRPRRAARRRGDPDRAPARRRDGARLRVPGARVRDLTTAITVFIVLLSDTLGFPALEAADERAIATAIGIAVAGLAFLVFGEGGRETPAPGRAASRLTPILRTRTHVMETRACRRASAGSRTA